MTEYNERQMPFNNQYQQAYSDKPFLGSGQSNLITKTHYVNIDSRDRDRVIYPSTNKFKVMFEPSDNYNGASTGYKHKNVHSIKLKNITVPNLNNVLDQAYLLLDISEFHNYHTVEGTNRSLQKAFTKIHLLETTNAFAKNSLEFSAPSELIFEQSPLASLNSLTITILKPDGTPFVFGTDTSPPTAVNEAIQTSMSFEITTLLPDSLIIPRRNV